LAGNGHGWVSLFLGAGGGAGRSILAATPSRIADQAGDSLSRLRDKAASGRLVPTASIRASLGGAIQFGPNRPAKRVSRLAGAAKYHAFATIPSHWRRIPGL
ncbi:MAG: hypothetical protein ABSC26_05060, partial [Stellaceae bacterium]